MEERIPEGQKIYFLSDAHLGLPPQEKSLAREKLLVQWLNEVSSDAKAIYLLGDIFDYWFEYKKVVPKGFTRFLGKISELCDAGIEINIFTGNHDVWMFDYLPQETGVNVFRQAIKRNFNGKIFYMAHGDGLGPGERSYKILKKIFTSKILQWMYARIHPNAATGFAHLWSRRSRFSKGNYVPFLGEEKEHLISHSKKVLEEEYFDYFIYGHRHVPIDIKIGQSSRVIYLGDWFINFTFAVFDGKEMALKKYPH
jgi:UDP-2,3-diacylglucosamine hydrolase